jgi:poly(hydroxyalkanoate) depolymerase family esterase
MDASRPFASFLALLVASAGCSASSGQTYDTDLDAGADVVDDVVSEESGPEDAADAGIDAELDAPVEEDADLDAAVGGGELLSRTYVGPEGTRDYLLYVPAGYDGTPRPLVLALHGCSQSASQFAYVSGYNHLADQKGFLVVWPEQNIMANASMCWNWFLPGHQGRTVGEAAILAGMVGDVAGSHAVDPKRVHAVGISAGAAMSVVLGAVFAEKFASIGSVEGCPFNGTPCVGSPSLLPASTLAQYVVDAMGTNARPVPLFVIQGTLDMNILPQNAELLVQQWLRAADAVDDGVTNGSISTTADHTDTGTALNGHAYKTDVYLDGAEDVFVERWLITGLGHAWPGGATAIAYSDPQGPSATEESYRFFEEHPMP